MTDRLAATVAAGRASLAALEQQMATPIEDIIAQAWQRPATQPPVELPATSVADLQRAQPDAAARFGQDVRVRGLRGTRPARRAHATIGLALANLA